MTEKFQTNPLPRENISFSIPVENVMKENTSIASVEKKQQKAPPKASNTIFVFLMGHEEMKAGWIFAEPSWGIKIDGQVKGIFPDNGHGKGKDEAISYAKKVAAEIKRDVYIIE